MTSVLHVLPHPGGGGERIVEMLEELGEGYGHARFALASTREPFQAAPQIAARWPRLARGFEGADLLHVIGDMASLLCLPLLTRRPAVIGTHGLHFLRRAGGMRRRAAERGMRLAAARAARVVCSSRAELEELLRLVDAGDAARLRIVVNGIPVGDRRTLDERRRARRELSLAEGAVVGLFLGELEERKDPLTAIEAARMASDRRSALILLVAGGGPLLDAARQQAGGAVQVLGFRDDSARLIAAADFLVLPSRREGLSLAMLEAMAAGLPVVAADVPASREAVADTGLLVPGGDVDGFAQAIHRLAAEAGLRESLGRAAHRRAAARFSIKRYLTEMREVFEESLEDWGHRHPQE